jgi:uncharacterized OB-fold protein
MEIPRYWRRKKQYLNLVGEVCPHCDEFLFPPRDICTRCRRGTLENNLDVQIGAPNPNYPSKLLPMIMRQPA